MLRLVEPQVEVSDKKCIGIVRKLQPVSAGTNCVVPTTESDSTSVNESC